MMAFALVFSLLVERQPPLAFLAALTAWCMVSVAAWWAWRYARFTGRTRDAHIGERRRKA